MSIGSTVLPLPRDCRLKLLNISDRQPLIPQVRYTQRSPSSCEWQLLGKPFALLCEISCSTRFTRSSFGKNRIEHYFEGDCGKRSQFAGR